MKKHWRLIASVLLFVLFVAAASGRMLAAPAVRPDRSADREQLLSGNDEEGRLALELLPDERVNVNTATAEELRRLPGIGEVLAEAIVSYREEYGPFASVDDLLKVKGIGEARQEAIRDHVALED